jgi:hypothetical protein
VHERPSPERTLTGTRPKGREPVALNPPEPRARRNFTDARQTEDFVLAEQRRGVSLTTPEPEELFGALAPQLAAESMPQKETLLADLDTQNRTSLVR